MGAAECCPDCDYRNRNVLYPRAGGALSARITMAGSSWPGSGQVPSRPQAFLAGSWGIPD